MDALRSSDTADVMGSEVPGAVGGVLHRVKRDLQWSDVETFYADKNNFAMYLVLPIIVLVYGGCAVIYCIARCRRFMKRRKKKNQSNIEEDEPLDNFSNEPSGHAPTTVIPSIPVSSARDGATTSSEVNVSMQNERETPLPWQVPGDNHAAVGGAAASAAVIHANRDNMNNGYPNKTDGYPNKNDGYTNKGFENDYPEKRHPSPRPPPSYDESYKQPRPMSKPPPYEEKGVRHRRGSVEEIITLDAQPNRNPMPENNQQNYNDRKRPRPGSRPSSRTHSRNDLRNEPIDEEREKARQLVRGDRPLRRDPPPNDRIDRQKTPDIISHARTQPLQPHYKPPQRDPKAEAALMARQAAQLLRLDQMGKQAGKKQKRLVFVAE